MRPSPSGLPLVRSWFAFLLRLLTLPTALLTIYLECYGASPTAASLILLRLSRRLRLKTFVLRMLKKEHDTIAAAAMHRAQSPHKPSASLLTRKRSESLQETSGAAPSAHANANANHPCHPQPQRPPQRLARHLSVASDCSSSSSSSSASSAVLSFSSPTLPMPHHTRSHTMSHTHADIVRQGKRLSLQFPIQPAAGSSSNSNSPAFSPRQRPQSWMAAPSPLLSPDPAPNAPGSILAVLAAQERYVLELREELTKAEEDLKTLKKHYAQHEASKRRGDARRPPMPLNTSLANSPADDTDDDSGISMQREMERRKALLSNTRSSQRKVFSGSRHLRTLSLLSPDRSYAPAFPQPIDLLSDEPQARPRPRRPSPPARTLTSETTSRQLIDVASSSSSSSNNNNNSSSSSNHSDRYDIPNIQRENIIRAGKQMASDFSNGLFTFIEDIRQATVGDEAVNGAVNGSGPSQNRGPSSKSPRNISGTQPPLSRTTSTRKKPQATGSIGEDFWSEHGLSEPKSTPVSRKTHTVKPAQTPQSQTQPTSEIDTDFEDDWDWDTTNPSFGANTADTRDDADDSDDPNRTITSASYHAKRHDSKNSSVATISSASMPDKTSRDPKRNSLPWSDLGGLSPSNLKRTASHLMKEWEKQLTPPPESRLTTHPQGDYIERMGSPTGLP